MPHYDFALAPYLERSWRYNRTDRNKSASQKHPHIEQRNFKLWLTSKALLDQVLHNAELCHTDFAVDKIARRLPDICAEFVLPPRYGDS